MALKKIEEPKTLPNPSCFSLLIVLFKISKVEATINMELYIKAGPNDGEIGDCPFAQYVRCVLAYKGIDCQVFNNLKPLK